MNNQLLDVKVKCRNNERCLFDGTDIPLDIEIRNNQDFVIGFPLEYMRAKSPIIKLVDNLTKAETDIPTHIASWDLKEKFTMLKPGESVTVGWLIGEDELQQFGSAYVDVSARVTILVEILVNEKKVEFRGDDTIRIISKHKANIS